LDDSRYIRNWVDNLPKMGRLSFSLGDVTRRFPDMAGRSVSNALHRLIAAGRLRSVWRGFYAIVLPEYGIDGDVPPVEYIDQLMEHLQTDYYVALLSAASYQGASHQSPQVFQVMCGRHVRSKSAGGLRLDLAFKGRMPKSGIEQETVKSGTVNVSTPALTALDLVGYPARVGGINNAASALAELADSIDFGALDAGLLREEPRATIQRLGHLLESAVGEQGLADSLYSLCGQSGLKFNRTDLVPGRQSDKSGYDGRWKIVLNYDVEVEE
jgi:predicted transcriptional regulator of viral defense system